MHVRRFRRLAIAIASAGVVLAATSAQAVDAEHLEWTAFGWSDCTTGTSSGWSCSYDLYSNNCPELAIAGETIRSCDLYIHVEAKIVPVLNAAGRLVGCTSGATDTSLPGSYAGFTSHVDGQFDNSSIDQVFLGRIHDAFGDGNPGALDFTAFEQGQGEPVSTWLVKGTYGGSCKRGASGIFSSSGVGTVDVQV